MSNAPRSATTPEPRRLATGRDWSVGEYACTSGPGDRAFEEQHTWTTIAAVLEGTFTYRSATGTAILYPGAVLLGNHGTCFECGHEHSTGDRCIAIHIAPALFEEIAASVEGSSRFRFKHAMLPAGDTAWISAVERFRARLQPFDMDEAVTGLLERALRLSSGAHAKPTHLSARDVRRIMAAVRRIEDNASEPISLDELAADACMSKYHFLRSFRRALGTTPYQLLLDVRLRRAAFALLNTRERISTIAYDVGFADLSTFNNRFKSRFGESPSHFRRRGA